MTVANNNGGQVTVELTGAQINNLIEAMDAFERGLDYLLDEETHFGKTAPLNPEEWVALKKKLQQALTTTR